MAQPTALPVIDISRFRDPGADRDAFLAELRAAAHEVGFFYVTGHGVPATVRDEVLQAARAFFALPEERRLEIENLNSPQFRGYTRIETEYTADSAGPSPWPEPRGGDVVAVRGHVRDRSPEALIPAAGRTEGHDEASVRTDSVHRRAAGRWRPRGHLGRLVRPDRDGTPPPICGECGGG
ncbi:2-oxoglutarate and iron-dependent oxygenase domain-containing protein [Streptomyces sp. NPDC005209]|uniref:2-oxoglutarate and iron-dependent oxygenase domain-containing protein n=1 Tax=Streptomyces sp. NPDC005209 TaxID=3156715 RepID=UPI0033AE1278